MIKRAQEIFNAVKADNLAKIQALIEKDTSLVKIKDGACNKPLHQAAISGSVKIHEVFKGVCPSISPDGNFFFLNSGRIYCMLASFISETQIFRT